MLDLDAIRKKVDNIECDQSNEPGIFHCAVDALCDSCWGRIAAEALIARVEELEGRTSPRVLAVIPARGGSKRFPRKNLALLDGRPLIVHTIEVALACPSISRVVVSTDDPEIARVSQEAGVAVMPRPDHLATDEALTEDVIRHALNAAEESKGRFDLVTVLQPTSPLRIPADVENGRMLAERTGAPIVKSCRQVDRATYRLNGAVYVIRRATALSGHWPDPLLYVMPPERSIDIDTQHDLTMAEAMLNDPASLMQRLDELSKPEKRIQEYTRKGE